LKRKKDNHGILFYDDEHRAAAYLNHSLYKEVSLIEEWRIFHWGLEDIEIIEEEIKCRVKITKHEIFKIGELLMIGKKLCQKYNKRFQQWIEDKFDFSYETAKNFMNVWKNCFGYRNWALNVPTSILYQIAMPKFDDNLRKYLFENGNLEKMTNGRFKQLLAKFKQGGWEAIEEDMLEINRYIGGIRIQYNYTLDMCKSALRTLEGLKSKIEKHGQESNEFIDFIGSAQRSEPEAGEINEILYEAIQDNITSLEKAIVEADEILDEYLSRINNKIA